MDIEFDKSTQYELSQSLRDHVGAARCLDIRNNNLITGSMDKKVHLYSRCPETQKFEKKRTYSFFGGYIMSLCFLQDGTEFAVGCQDKKIYIASVDDHEYPTLVFEGKIFTSKKSRSRRPSQLRQILRVQSFFRFMGRHCPDLGS